MPLVVGLGNPGCALRAHAPQRRLAGGGATGRALARREPTERRRRYRAWRRDVAGRDGAMLMQPLTFMNLSGEALDAWRAAARARAGVAAGGGGRRLPAGRARCGCGPRGSSGGHRGLESVEAALGEPGVTRGCASASARRRAQELREHVLDELGGRGAGAARAGGRDRAADAVECWVGEGILAAMNRFNRKVRKEVPEP